MQLDGDFAQLLRACAEYMLAGGTARGPPLLQRDPPNALFEQAGSLGTGSLDPAAIANPDQGGGQRAQGAVAAGQARVILRQSLRCQSRQLARLAKSAQGQGQCLLQHHLLDLGGRETGGRRRVLTGERRLGGGVGTAPQQFAQPLDDRHEGTREGGPQAGEQALALRCFLALGQLLRLPGSGHLAGLDLSQAPGHGLAQLSHERRVLLR